MRPQRHTGRSFVRHSPRGVAPGSNGSVVAAIRRASQDKPIQSTISEAPYVTKNQFSDFSISPQLKANIIAKGYTVPTPIQDQAIPAISEGRDVIGIANTGTGKTAAFLIPLIEKISKDKNQRVLIVTPTRELALQIGAELRDFARGMGIRWAMLIGGASMWRQKQDLDNGAHVVIGTPGRIKDFIEERALSMSQFRNVVLDEADRMVDIGFIRDVTYFISLLPRERQSLFFSATVSGKVSEILAKFVRNPVTVSVKKHETAQGVTQRIIEVTNGKKKIEYLYELLIQKGFDKVLIFGRTKWGIEKLSRNLADKGFNVAAIHGNKNQSQRQRALDAFKNNHVRILLATDVASRGIDVSGITHVINYDAPQTYDDYIHRIGRTGRADAFGTALTFVD